MAKQLLFDTDARQRVLQGVRKISGVVKSTLGPGGRNVILQKSFGSPVVTKDGVTVAKEIELEEPFENMGAKMVREVATKTNDIAGDGTTTATVLAEAIFAEGLKAIGTPAPTPMVIQARYRQGRRGRGGQEALESMAKPVKNSRRTRSPSIARSISANGDAHHRRVCSPMPSRRSVSDGVVTVEEAKGMDTDVGGGRRHGSSTRASSRPTSSPTPRQDPVRRPRGRARSSSTRRRSAIAAPDLVPGARGGRPEGPQTAARSSPRTSRAEALSALVINRLRGDDARSCAVKAPGFGDRRKAMLEDLSVLVGGTRSSHEGHWLRAGRPSTSVHLGHAAPRSIDHEGPDDLLQAVRRQEGGDLEQAYRPVRAGADRSDDIEL